MAAEGLEHTAFGDHTTFGDLLGVTETVVDTADPVSLVRSYGGALRRAALRPWRTAPALRATARAWG